MNGLSFGIPGVGAVRRSTHVCALYSGPAERDRLLFPFLEEALRCGGKCLCLIDGTEPALVRDVALGQPGPGYERRAAQLDVERASDSYLRLGEFRVPDIMGFLSGRVAAALAGDFDQFRAVGEMSWVLSKPPGWEELFLYEAAVNRSAERMPAILMCLYDLQNLGAQMLVDILRTHPTVLLDNAVIDNPFYAHPPDYADVAAVVGYPIVKVVVEDGGEDASPRWATLTYAEGRVVSCVARGMTNRGIAEELHLSRHTVDAHLKHVYVKLDIHSRVELTVLAMQLRVRSD